MDATTKSRPAQREPLIDRQGTEVLAQDECRALVSAVPVGRIAYLEDGQPLVLPVNHHVDGAGIVFRTATGGILDAASRERPAAFEADAYDDVTRTGWSVLMRGTLALVDERQLPRLEQLDLHPWADAIARPNWVRLSPTRVTGRRILRHIDLE